MASAKTSNGLRLSAEDAKRGRIPWRLRLHAWWNGYQLEVPKVPARPVTTADRDHAVRAPDKVLPWTDRRIGLVQEVWGDGFDRPGGSDDVLTLLKPCGLDPKMSVVELGAGLGGGTRAVCREFGIWISGLEGDGELARVGQNLSDMAGLTKKAPIFHTLMAEMELKRLGYDVVFGREAFYSLPDKTRLLHEIANGMKPRGQLLFTDYALAEPNADTPELKAWREAEPEGAAPWAVSDYMDTLNDLKLDIRISEDRSDRQIAAIQQGWAAFMQAARKDGRLETYGELALREADVWNRRVKALESGALRLYRFHAIKPSQDKTLADW